VIVVGISAILARGVNGRGRYEKQLFRGSALAAWDTGGSRFGRALNASAAHLGIAGHVFSTAILSAALSFLGLGRSP